MNLQGRNLQQGVTGDDVRLLHTELTLLNLAIPDNERAAALYGAATLAAVQQFQRQHTPPPITGIVDPPTAAAINATVNAQFPPASTVSGSVYSALSAGVGGLNIQVVDKNAGPDLLLALGAADDRGFYSVHYSPAAALRQGKSAPDIQVRVLAANTLVSVSEVRYDATATEVLDIVLPDSTAATLSSEYSMLTSAVAAHYQGKLGNLQETDERSDITYLANKTGWGDPRPLAMAALADQFSSRTGSPFTPAPAIAPVFFYALLRAGLPADENILYRTDPKTLQTIWTNAVAQGVIPSSIADTIPDALKQFQIRSTDKVLNGPALAGVSSLKDMLAASRLTDPQQQLQFATLYAANSTDMPAFWKAVGTAFGQATATSLQSDGKIARLTGNNHTLMQALRAAGGTQGISDPIQLAQTGYHRPKKWTPLLTQSVAIPKEIPGDTPEVRQTNYAALLAAQVRLSYPTAAVAEMVKSDLAGVVPDQVQSFLAANQKDFDIGLQPVERYIADKNLQVDPDTVKGVKKLQRVLQITPSDQAMTGLLKHGIDAAYHVVRYDKGTFVRSFAQDLGGADQAALIYDRSQLIHNVTLIAATAYLAARRGVSLGAPPTNAGQTASMNGGQLLRPAPMAASDPNAAGVLAYPTLESLFGAMDFCACDHCRSVLSPAAYLVDLLHFIGPDADVWTAFTANWKADHGGAPYPYASMAAWTNAGKPAGTEISPLDVLLSRRPDIQHLPLTCENTNTELPYIDIVNETLEYFVANTVQPLSLKGFAGHDTKGVATEDLMASPQFVVDAAYTILRGERFPLPLPFHQPLENLRQLFSAFQIPLFLVMERLRKADTLERGANPYGWRDILMETVGLSPEEHETLTDSTAVPLWRMYGFSNGTTDANVIAGLSNAKQFARRISISYRDVVCLLRTRFINPNSDLVPKLERLGVSFAALKGLQDGTITDAAFDALLPTGAGAPDPASYGGDIKAWVKNPDNFARIMAIIVLADPTPGTDGCNFDALEFRYSRPMTGQTDTSTRLGSVEFVRLLRFIRLWKRTGWTIEQTDAAICALYRVDFASVASGDIDTVTKLDAGFLTLLPRLGIALRVMDALNLTPGRDLTSLLACLSDIGTQGADALYPQMFLNAAILSRDAIFADNGYGAFLQKATVPYTHPQATLESAIVTAAQGRISYDSSRKQLSYNGTLDAATRDALKAVAGVSAAFKAAIDALYAAQRLNGHVEALRSAFGLTGDEFARIVGALKYNADTPLTLANITAIYRRGWLARKLHLSVRELLLLLSLTGLNPFALPDPTHPAIVRFVALVHAIKDRSLKPAAALYLIWNQDLSGKSAPDPQDVMEFARTLRSDFAAIDDQFAATDDPSGDVARARMTLVYGQETSNTFFTLLENTLVVDLPYTHGSLSLEAAITSADPNLTYDNFRHLLSHTGLLNATKRDGLKAVPGVTVAFKNAVDGLFAQSADIAGAFFTRYPELKPLYDAYIGSSDSPEKKRSALLAAFRPELAARRKRQQALQRLAAAASVDLTAAQTLLDPNKASYPFHAARHADQPALNDVVALETAGLAAQFYFRDSATGSVDLSVPAAANLDYVPGSANPLPVNPTPNTAISGIWQGRIETPEPGYYNLVIEADESAKVALTLNEQPQPLTQNGTIRRNTNPLQLNAGTLYDFQLTVEKAKDRLSVKWETPKRPREVIPGRYLYPPSIVAPFNAVYVRFLKTMALASGLGVTANEIAYFAIDPTYRISGDGWLNALSVSGDPAPLAAAGLLVPFEALLGFARIKAELSANDDQVLDFLQVPSVDSPFLALTRWDQASLSTVLTQFGKTIADLAHFDVLRRVYDAFTVIRPVGVPGAALIRATTNAPDGGIARDFEAALRARYATADWRTLIQPINDTMRSLRRDALVAYILHQMRSIPATAQIDTPDKLFEYFLMDVRMEPCMPTSRVRHALSSAQLFIERGLMNLEPQVSPAVIDAEQWAWMKRYRVWEANRKVFLWPENWLEPELRDDKSPIFKEVESELLQSDITDDSASAALLNYLAKLEEVAKLEPCGMHYVEPAPGRSEVMHVVARTAGAHRKYYYRRHEFGYWVPWEQIKLDIEDNPVIPVVWQDRLLLFWLRILKSGPTKANAPRPVTDESFANLHMSALAVPEPAVTVQAALCWSEYYNGKWQSAKTSDVDRPTTVPLYSGTFDRASVRLGVSQEGDALRVYFAANPAGSFDSNPVRGWPGSFLFHNTHSLPVRGEDTTPPPPPAIGRRPLTDDPHKNDFAFEYEDPAGADFPRDVLKPTTQPPPFTFIEPRHDLNDTWNAPMFFADGRNVFLVATREQPVWIRDYGGYGILNGVAGLGAVQIPPLVIQPPPLPQPKISTTDTSVHRGLGTTLTVKYGNLQIGRSTAVFNGGLKI
jgi:Neuraminidase-like domain/Putative peptidoglycan binding domain